MSAWPPFFVRFAASLSRIMPAHVPQVGRRSALTKSRRGSRRLERSAMRAIVVDSPPGREGGLVKCLGVGRKREEGRTRDDERGASCEFGGCFNEDECEGSWRLEADGGFLEELDVLAEGALESCWSQMS